MGMKTLAGGKILEGAEDSGDQGDGWRWILEAHRDLDGWFLWAVIQQELTQHSWAAMFTLWEREINNKWDKDGGTSEAKRVK